MTARSVALTLAAALVLSAPSCVTRRHARPLDGRVFGVYRCTLVESGKSRPEFRMLVFAQLPDRLHAEVLGPMGGPRLVLDAGAGAMSVTDVGEKVAYAGRSDPGALSRLIGVSVGVERLVEILLRGTAADEPPAFSRRPEQGEGLPRSLELRTADRAIRLERISERPVRADAVIGSGEPPTGVEVRPLEELSVDAAEAR